MIERRDVVRLKVPFPDISSGLAVRSHMYICRQVENSVHSFVKCQSLKPWMLTSSIFQHYWDEQPDISRNPFQHETRIDCDKEFFTTGIQYDDALKTISRPDVCEDVMREVERELFCDGFDETQIDEAALLQINQLVERV